MTCYSPAGVKRSAHRSHTLPDVLCCPKPLASYTSTGTVPVTPPGRVLSRGKSPGQEVIRSRPPGAHSSPQGQLHDGVVLAPGQIRAGSPGRAPGGALDAGGGQLEK